MLFNLVVLILTINIAAILIHCFILIPLKNAERFKLYSLRDDLCMLAMSGKLSESDRNYQLLMQLINIEINLTK